MSRLHGRPRRCRESDGRLFLRAEFRLCRQQGKHPNDPGETIGDSPSWTWFGNQPDGGGPKPLPLSDAYAAAQADEPYYNQYAAVLNNSATPLTDSYGFPFTDRLTAPLMPTSGQTLPDRSYVPFSRSIVRCRPRPSQRLRANIVPGYVHGDAHRCCNSKMTWKRPRISAPRPSIVAQRFALQRRFRFFRL